MEPEKTPFMDRRKYIRLTDTLIVRCARLSLPPALTPIEAHWMASTIDVSEGGVLLRSPERLKLGEGIEILFELDRTNPPIKVQANVVRYHAVMYDKIYYVPAAFTAMNPADRDRLKAYLSRHAAKTA